MRGRLVVRSKLSSTAIGVAWLFSATSSVAYAESCDITLFKHMESENVKRENYIFILDQVNRDNYEEMKTGICASVPGYFTGNYDQFREKREQYRRDLQITVQQKYSREYAVNTLNRAGLEAYNACLRSQRKESELIVYRDDNAAVDKRITFVVDLDTRVALRGPVMVEVFGAGRLLSATDKDTSVKRESDVLHISIENLIGGKQFTVERPDRKAVFQATAQIAGKVAKPLEVGPHLEPVAKEVDVDVSVENTTQLLARRLQPGTDNYDFVWAHDGVSPNNNGVPRGTTFVGNACLCPSGERTSWDLGFREAGRCVPPKDSSEVRLLPETVKFHPEDYLRNSYTCGGLPQGAVKLQPGSGAGGVCYDIAISLNAPPSGSIECAVRWKIVGKARRKMVVFENR